MPAPSRKRKRAEEHIEESMPHLPFYVVEYIRAKKRARLSPTTLSGYIYDYTRFFDWLRQEGMTDATENKDIPYSVLENLKKGDIEFFFEMLMESNVQKATGIEMQRSESSTKRYISSLKSLFNYLTTETEDEDGNTYFDRNVMSKIKTLKKVESASSRAKRINSMMLDGDEMKGLLQFVKNEYVHHLTPRQQVFFEKNQLRDIAILSLFMGSGIRLSELAGLLKTDIDFMKGDIRVLRKGNGIDVVSITPTALRDLEAYLDERERLYRPDPKNLYVFLTIYGGAASQISSETVEKIVKKYTSAYLSGKQLSPHKLRHSFSKQFLDNGGNLVALRDQLGHNSIETTVQYTNLSQKEQRAILHKMDQKKEEDHVE